VVHRGGFGTCVPGAWADQPPPPTRRTAAHPAESRTARWHGPRAQALGARPGRTLGRPDGGGCVTRTA
jgi:hypothetical protein